MNSHGQRIAKDTKDTRFYRQRRHTWYMHVWAQKASDTEQRYCLHWEAEACVNPNTDKLMSAHKHTTPTLLTHVASKQEAACTVHTPQPKASKHPERRSCYHLIILSSSSHRSSVHHSTSHACTTPWQANRCSRLSNLLTWNPASFALPVLHTSSFHGSKPIPDWQNWPNPDTFFVVVCSSCTIHAHMRQRNRAVMPVETTRFISVKNALKLQEQYLYSTDCLLLFDCQHILRLQA